MHSACLLRQWEAEVWDHCLWKHQPEFLLGLQTGSSPSWPSSSGLIDFPKPCTLLCKLPMPCVSTSEHREHFKCCKRREHRGHRIPARGPRGYHTRIHSFLVPWENHHLKLPVSLGPTEDIFGFLFPEKQDRWLPHCHGLLSPASNISLRATAQF